MQIQQTHTTDLRADMLGYAHTDMLFYRSPEEALATKERALWDPILHWAEERYGVRFILTEGMMPVTQPAEWEAALAKEIDALPEDVLRELGILTKILGSIITALALYYQQCTIEEAIEAGFLEEDHHAAQWGEDEEALAKREGKKAECRNAYKALDSMVNSAKTASE